MGRNGYWSWEQDVFTCGFLHIHYSELSASIWLWRVMCCLQQSFEEFYFQLRCKAKAQGAVADVQGLLERAGHSSQGH